MQRQSEHIKVLISWWINLMVVVDKHLFGQGMTHWCKKAKSCIETSTDSHRTCVNFYRFFDQVTNLLQN